MSISPAVGAISKYLSEIKLSSAWRQGRTAYDTVTERIPVVGTRAVELSRRVRQSVISLAQPGQLFEDLGITYIGVMPGHALLGAQFTATSMIGMIALAGIIVRNSILLVDFINAEIAAGRPSAEAVVAAAAIRARPIALTALAAMTGAFFILDDPIFNGLAISLIFGILVSTVLTLLLIPVLYYGYINRTRAT